MRDQVPDAVKVERVDALMQAQQEVAFALNEERVGKDMTVLIDGALEDDDLDFPVAVGRHEGQAPDIDSVTYVERCAAPPGRFVKARCVAHEDYDLIAAPTSVGLPILS